MPRFRFAIMLPFVQRALTPHVKTLRRARNVAPGHVRYMLNYPNGQCQAKKPTSTNFMYLTNPHPTSRRETEGGREPARIPLPRNSPPLPDGLAGVEL